MSSDEGGDGIVTARGVRRPVVARGAAALTFGMVTAAGAAFLTAVAGLRCAGAVFLLAARRVVAGFLAVFLTAFGFPVLGVAAERRTDFFAAPFGFVAARRAGFFATFFTRLPAVFAVGAFRLAIFECPFGTLTVLR
jgi:hypothetical protein